MPPKQQQIYQAQGLSFTSGLDPVVPMNQPLTSKLQGTNPDFLDYNRKALYMSWHPEHPLVAVAGLNNLYIYSQ